MKKITIIVPVYNAENYLKKCLDSLVKQTLKDIDIIVINDGSTDKSMKIIEKYCIQYDNVRMISRENRGISYSRNEGIKLAKTPYIAFVDSDDYVELDMYEKLYNLITKDESSIAICNYKFFDDKHNFVNKNIEINCKITSLQENPTLIWKMDYMPWNKLYKKDLFDDICFPLDTKYEDLEAILKVFSKAKKVSFTNEHLYNYYLNPKGETGTISKTVYDIFKILNNLYDYFYNKSKIININFKILYVSKVFVYNRYILNTGNRNFSMEYISTGYDQIKMHYKIWKIPYLFNSKTKKEFFLRFLEINRFLYMLYICFRTRKTN